MPTRIYIGLFTLAGFIAASYWNDLAASYIALVGGAVVYLLHSIEFKVNRLLDDRGITVTDKEISKD